MTGHCRRIGIGSVVLCCAISAAASVSAADQPKTARVRLSDHATLCLHVPAGWAYVEPAAGVPDASVEVAFTPARGDGTFKFMLTIFKGSTKPSDEQLRGVVEAARDGAAASAVESRLEVKELLGKDLHGWYFSATDRAPKPGEYKYLTQGTGALGDWLVSFTSLSHQQDGAAAAGLDMLQGAWLEVD